MESPILHVRVDPEDLELIDSVSHLRRGKPARKRGDRSEVAREALRLGLQVLLDRKP